MLLIDVLGFQTWCMLDTVSGFVGTDTVRDEVLDIVYYNRREIPLDPPRDVWVIHSMRKDQRFAVRRP